MKRLDPLLRTQPWKILAVFQPIERVISRIEIDGTVTEAGRQIVFRGDSSGDLYDLPEAIRGVVDFHRLAASRYQIPADADGLERLGNKLRLGSPVFENDLEKAKASIASCKAQAMRLRQSQAVDLLQTVQIGLQIELLKVKRDVQSTRVS